MTALAQPSMILLLIAQRDKLGYTVIADGSPQKYVYFFKKNMSGKGKIPETWL